MRTLLTILDQLIGVLHALLLVTVLFGWVFPETFLVHRVALGLVGFSWFGLGAFKGVGYCVLTDLQRRIKKQLGTTMEGPTFIASLFQKVGVTLSPLVVNILAYGFYFLSLAIAVAQHHNRASLRMF